MSDCTYNPCARIQTRHGRTVILGFENIDEYTIIDPKQPDEPRNRNYKLKYGPYWGEELKKYLREVKIKLYPDGSNTFDTEDPECQIKLRVLEFCDAIAKNKNSVNGSVHKFYIEDEVQEASDELGNNDLLISASQNIKKLSKDQMIHVISWLASNGRLRDVATNQVTESVLRASLISYITDTNKSRQRCKEINDITTDPMLNHKGNIYYAIRHNIIIYRLGEGYYFNQIRVGKEIEDVLSYFLDKSNVTEYARLVEEGKKMKEAKEFSNDYK
jgi:hypothetical protein